MSLQITLNILILTAFLGLVFGVPYYYNKKIITVKVSKACAAHARNFKEGEERVEILKLPAVIYDKKTNTPLHLKDYLIVRVSGDSMENYNIPDSSLALFKPYANEDIKAGDIVLIENEKDEEIQNSLKDPIPKRIRTIKGVDLVKGNIHFNPYDKVIVSDNGERSLGHKVRKFEEVKGIYVNSYVPSV